MREVSIPIADVLVWVKRVGRDAALSALVGRGLDDGVSDTIAAIEDVAFSADGNAAAFILSGGVRALAGRLRAAGAAIVEARPGAPLAEAIEAGRTDAERTARAQARTLGKLGLDAARLGTDDARAAIVGFVESLDSGALPDPQARQAAYDAFKNAEPRVQSAGAQLFRRLAAFRAAKFLPVPEDVHWRVACLLRYSGAIRDAIAASDILHDAGLRDRGARKILATTRAAALLQLWEAPHETALVREADAAFRIAWSIDRSDDELKAVRQLLNRAIEQAGLDDLGTERQNR